MSGSTRIVAWRCSKATGSYERAGLVVSDGDPSRVVPATGEDSAVGTYFARYGFGQSSRPVIREARLDSSRRCDEAAEIVDVALNAAAKRRVARLPAELDARVLNR